jgi:hypothetical protein
VDKLLLIANKVTSLYLMVIRAHFPLAILDFRRTTTGRRPILGQTNAPMHSFPARVRLAVIASRLFLRNSHS